MSTLYESYALVNVISRTNTCEVALVESTVNAGKYLIKSIRKNKGTDRHLDIKKRFCREIDIVSSLDHPNIPKPVDTHIESDVLYIVYPYEGGQTLQRHIELKDKFPVGESLHIIRQILSALEYVHSRGIIHADVNPYNIYITENGKAQLLDFGFSMTEDDARMLPEGRIIGTFPYLSPEQMGFTDFKIDTRTDIFCLLVVLYRMIAGKMPFPLEDETLKSLLDAILKRDALGVQNVPQCLNEIMLKGLRPSAKDRYQTAEGLSYDLSIAAETILSEGTGTFRAGDRDAALSVMRQRLFVERENELDILHKSYDGFLKGKSSHHLIVGKSGIGKTEIIREFRSKISSAHTDLVFVKCNRFSLAQPYAIIRQVIIEFLSLRTSGLSEFSEMTRELINSQLTEHSGTICSIVPEMKQWFRRVNDRTEIEQEREADRIHHVLYSVLILISSIRKTVIVIDDIQWVDKISFKIIEKLLGNRESCMLICNYRTAENDEAVYCFGRNLMHLSFSTVIRVQPFTKENIRKIIGRRFGQVENVELLLELLTSKTDGIPYVLNEAVRYLVSNCILICQNGKWQLGVSGNEALPEKFDQVSLMVRKLEGVDDKGITVIRAASLLEGRFEEQFLAQTIGMIPSDVHKYIMKFGREGILQPDLSGRYSFTHDRVQETVAASISDTVRYELYEKIADGYCRLAESDRERLFDAAECFLKSKNLVRAITVSYRAAMYATEKSALDVAIRYFKNLLFIADIVPKERIDPEVDLVKANVAFASVLMMTGSNEQALNIFQKMLAIETLDKYTRVEMIYKSGCIHHAMGEFEKSSPYFIEALRQLGVTVPTSKSMVLLGLASEVFRMVVTAKWMIEIHKKESDKSALLALRILNKLSYSMYFTQMVTSMYLQFLANRRAQNTIDSFEKAEAFAMHGIAAYQLMRKKRAFKMLDKSEYVARSIGRNDVMAFVKSFSGLTRYYFADWKKSASLLAESIHLYSSIGDVGNQILSAEHLWKVALMRGEVDAAVNNMNATIDLCKKTNEKYFHVVTCAALNHTMFLKTGVFNRERHQEVLDQLSKVDSALFHIEAGGYLLQSEIERLEYKSAYDRSMQLLPIISKKCINSEYQVREYSQFCYLICQEMRWRRKGMRRLETSQKKLKMQFVLYGLVHFAASLTFPAYRGAFYRNIGWFAGIHSFKWLASCFFKKAQKVHHQLDMRYEEACDLRDHGMFLDEFARKPGKVRDLLEDAYRLFRICGSKLQMKRIVDGYGIIAAMDEMELTHDETAGHESGKHSSSGINMLRFETLADVSRTITETGDPEILMRQILSAMITVTGAQYGCFFINKNTEPSRAPFAMSFEGKEVELESVPVFRDLISKVNELHAMQCSGERQLDNEMDTESEAIRSDLCIPLNWRDKYLGYVYLVNDRVRGLFGEAAQKSAMILAAHAGILLENANLMSKQKMFSDELQEKVDEQVEDIRNKKMLLEESNLKLIESERMKGILSGALVHDIKNYAAGISGNLIYLNRRIEKDEKSQKIMDVVAETCTDISSLASNLLDIAKMDDGKMVVHPERLDENYFDMMSEKFGRSTLFEEKEIVPSVYYPEKTFSLHADPYLLERVLQNLYSNAAKYAPKGSRVELRLEGNDYEDIICFYNSGTPIPDSEKEVLFEKYARIQNRKSEYSKGLGLFFCKMVMTAHHGRIWLDTDEHGNYFRMAFPHATNIIPFAAA